MITSIKEEAKAICEKNGLDFNISKRPLCDTNGNLSGYYGLWNDKSDNCIHTVKEGYVVSQNQEVIEMVLEGISPYSNELVVNKSGSINDGRKIYIQLGIVGDSFVNGDKIKRNITIIDSNDGSLSLSVGVGTLTMSCMNQFYHFYKQGHKVRHTATLKEKIKGLPLLIESALNRSMKQTQAYQFFASSQISDLNVHEMVKTVLGYDRELTSMKELSEKSTRAINKMDKLYSAIESEMAEKGRNMWGLHSGITYFTTHENSAPKRENGRVESLMLGNGYNMNQKSFEYAQLKSRMVVDLELV